MREKEKGTREREEGCLSHSSPPPPPGTKDCLRIERGTNVSHGQMEAYKGMRRNPVLG